MQSNTFQGLVITDGIERSFAIFTYQCGLLQWPVNQSDTRLPVVIGFQGEPDFYANLLFSSRNIASDIACANTPATIWNNVIYQLSPKPTQKSTSNK